MKKHHLLLATLLVLETAFSSQDASAKQAKTPAKANALPLQYVLQDIHGTVMIHDKKTGKTERAVEEQTVRAGDEVVTNPGAKASLTLNKNTLFQLSENSKVRVGKLAPQKTGKGFFSRLSLITGRILSEVENLRESHSTFEVESGGVVCGVRGTSFEVENNGKDVQTRTYHGVVELNKGSQTQNVEANQSQDFAFDKDTFLPKRTLTRQERETYQRWLTQKAVVERKYLERQAVLDSISNLSDDDQIELLKKLSDYPEKDHLRMMRQTLQDWAKAKRKRTLDQIQEDAAQKRKENDSLRKNP